MVNLIAPIISGLLVFVISTCFYIRYERRQQKLGVLRSLVGSRYALAQSGNRQASETFFQALNEAVAVFHDSEAVLNAIQNFKKYPSQASDNTTQLIRRMFDDLKIDVSFLDDDFFSSPLVPGNRE